MSLMHLLADPRNDRLFFAKAADDLSAALLGLRARLDRLEREMRRGEPDADNDEPDERTWSEYWADRLAAIVRESETCGSSSC